MGVQEDVLEQVGQALRKHPELGEARIKVTWEGDRLCLGGVVQTAEASELALALARQVLPESIIDNALCIAETRRAMKDVVARAFDEACAFLTGPVEGGRCELHANGSVYLYGACESLRDRRFLIHAISLMPGVRRVNGEHLGVNRPVDTDDVRLGDRANASLHVLGLDPACAVKVHVRDHIAHVQGTTRTEKEHRQILTALERTPGLQGIDDHLHAYQKSTPDNRDALLEQTLKRRLAQAGVPVAHIAVFFRDGVASLLGVVDTPAQYNEATQTSLTVPGVKHIDNQLVITARHGRATQGPREDLPMTSAQSCNGDPNQA